MNDKMYDLLEKMYIEVQGIKSEMHEMKSNMATKDDLKDFITKDDAKNFATKDDLKDFAKKEDLRNFATKDDIKNLATKDDLNLVADELHKEIQSVHDEVSGLRNDLNTMEIITTKNAYDIAKLKAVK